MRKRNRQGNLHSITDLSVEELMVRGEQLLQQNNFKNAIACFKQLVKLEGDAWQGQLIIAYLGRARELADKDMFKEAIIIWNNANSLQLKPLPSAEVIVWMFNAKQYDQALALFFKNEGQISKQNPDHWEIIGELIAVKLLVESPAIHPKIPDGSPWFKQNDAAHTALEAYVNGELEIADQALQKIPLRSAFKSFRLILKSLILWPKDREKAERLLEKIPKNSPFAELADVARHCTLDPATLAQKLSTLNPRQQKLLVILRGIDNSCLELFVQLHTTDKKTTPFQLLLKHADLFPATELRACCQGLLLENNRFIAQFEHQFGPLSVWEHAQISALTAERNKRPDQAYDHWKRCIEALQKEPKNTENCLKLALIHRHVTDKYLQNSGAISQKGVIYHLKKSLELDPDDKQTWIRVIQWHQKDARNLQPYYQWVDKGVKQFPNDGAMLTMAMDAAFEKKAFVKASRLGMRILEMDPINKRVWHKLINAHISHAWKQYGQGKTNLAITEMIKARALEQGETGEYWGRVHEGFLALRMEKTENGLALLKEAQEIAESGIIFLLRVALEGEQREIPAQHLKLFRDQLSRYNREKPVQNQVVEIVNLIDYYEEEIKREDVRPDLFFTLLSGYFNKAARLKYDLEPLRSICRILDDFDQFPLLKLFAQVGEKFYPEQPELACYFVYAQSNGGVDKISRKNTQKLEAALVRAQQAGDFETVDWILELLDDYGHGHCTCGQCGSRSGGSYDDPFQGDDFDFPFMDGDPDLSHPELMRAMLVIALAGEVFDRYTHLDRIDDTTLKTILKDILREKGLPFGGQPERKIIQEALMEIRRAIPYKPGKSQPGKPINMEPDEKEISISELLNSLQERFK